MTIKNNVYLHSGCGVYTHKHNGGSINMKRIHKDNETDNNAKPQGLPSLQGIGTSQLYNRQVKPTPISSISSGSVQGGSYSHQSSTGSILGSGLNKINFNHKNKKIKNVKLTL